MKVALFAVLLGASASTALAQNKYDVFVGQYMASVIIVNDCSQFVNSDVPEATQIAKTEDGLRKQKVLRLLYYSKTDSLYAVGNNALESRDVDAGNTTALCRFAAGVAGKNDKVGRFLRKK